MEISPEQERMIYQKLPKDIQDTIESACKKVSDLDKDDIKRIFLKAKYMISDTLERDYKYSSKEVERITSDLFEEYEYKVKNRAEDRRVGTYANSKDIISIMSRKEMLKTEEVDSLEHKKEELKHSCKNIVGYSEDIINDENIEAKRNYNNTVEDLILTELKSEIKRRMKVYDSREAEEAFSEVSSILSRRMLGDLQQSFDDNSRYFKNYVSAKINEVVTDFSNEYEKVIVSEEQNKDNKSNEKDDKLDLGDLVNSPEEALKSSQERESNKDINERNVLPIDVIIE